MGVCTIGPSYTRRPREGGGWRDEELQRGARGALFLTRRGIRTTLSFTLPAASQPANPARSSPLGRPKAAALALALAAHEGGRCAPRRRSSSRSRRPNAAAAAASCASSSSCGAAWPLRHDPKAGTAAAAAGARPPPLLRSPGPLGSPAKAVTSALRSRRQCCSAPSSEQQHPGRARRGRPPSALLRPLRADWETRRAGAAWNSRRGEELPRGVRASIAGGGSQAVRY